MYEARGKHQSVSIRQISKNRAEQVGYYGFLENQNVTVGELVRSLSDHCVSQVEGKHILAIAHQPPSRLFRTSSTGDSVVHLAMAN
ncbi:MAG: hypothetical protein MET45_15740 [Nostoc sp. LLA-1]|nr:hypothetical protein [Cyanocohniella sp. LLY]